MSFAVIAGLVPAIQFGLARQPFVALDPRNKSGVTVFVYQERLTKTLSFVIAGLVPAIQCDLARQLFVALDPGSSPG